MIAAFKAFLRAQRNLWRESLRHGAMRERWPGLQVTEPCSWTVDDFDSLEIGSPVMIGPFTEIVVAAKSRYSETAGRLRIGSRTVIGSSGNIRAAGGVISIGHDCLIAQQVSLIASNHTVRAGVIYHELPWDESKTGITIEDNVWIGCGVTVLPGCTIGRGAVVAAGSVVTRNVPASTIWAGTPAKQLRAVD